MARIFIYDGKELPDPDPGMSVEEVRQSLTDYFPELSNAETATGKRGDDETITFKKRVGTKGNQQLIQDGAIHGFFELSYAAYLVLPRTLLQSMPLDWQDKFVALLEEANEKYPRYMPEGSEYYVQLKDTETGRFMKDPLADYQRGRRRI
jgi:PRTRC genetic system protein C